jgi:hypothetical protein
MADALASGASVRKDVGFKSPLEPHCCCSYSAVATNFVFRETTAQPGRVIRIE